MSPWILLHERVGSFEFLLSLYDIHPRDLYHCSPFHDNDIIMSVMASQITSLTIVYSTVYSGTDQRKHQSSTSLAFCKGNSPVTGEFHTQRASNKEKVSIMELLPPVLYVLFWMGCIMNWHNLGEAKQKFYTMG